MGKNNRLSRDQKRKAKLKKRAERSRTHESLAYAGNKYKTPELTPLIFRTELGIYESYAMSEGELTDDDVEEAIEHMILRMRQGTLPALPDPDSDPGMLTGGEGDEEDFVVQSIRRNWQYYAEKSGLPAKDDLIGILRTILNSLDIWRSKNMNPQGYYQFLKGFMKDLGVSVRRLELGAEPSSGPAGAALPAPGPEGSNPSV